MKKIFAMILISVLLLVCATASALAASCVYLSGDCNVRSGPGLNYSTLGSVNRGSTLNFLGDTSYDNRGIAWYSISFAGISGWVSSVYTSLY